MNTSLPACRRKGSFIYEEFLTTGGTGEVYSAGHYGDLNF